MDTIKGFIRKYWFWFSIPYCLIMVVSWQSGGSLIGGLLSCAITSAISVWLVKVMLPERYAEMFCKESVLKGIKYCLPTLGASALLMVLSFSRSATGPEAMNSDAVVVAGVLITYPVVAVAEVFLLCGPVLHLMMNRYGKDDVGVFFATLYTGLVYGIVTFAYGCTYMISIEGASVIAVITQAIYVAASVMFLAAIYLSTENFYLMIAVRVIGTLLERAVEMISTQPVNLYTMVGLGKTDCIIIIVVAAVLFGVALNFCTSVVPWDKGDFVEKKKRELQVGRDPRLLEHRESRRLGKRRK